MKTSAVGLMIACLILPPSSRGDEDPLSLDTPKPAAAEKATAAKSGKSSSKPADDKSKQATEPDEKERLAREREQLDRNLTLRKELKAMHQDAKAPAASVDGMLSTIGQLDDALGEPPAKVARERGKFGPSDSLSGTRDELDKLTPAAKSKSEEPSAATVRAKRRNSDLLRARTPVGKPALFPTRPEKARK